MPTNTGIKIVAYADFVDLRKVKTRSSYIRAQIRKHSLKNMEAILYVNGNQTRFRLLLNVNDLGMVCCPEIDERTKYSLYLQISETMARLTGVNTIKVSLSDVTKRLEERQQRAKSRKKRKR